MPQRLRIVPGIGIAAVAGIDGIAFLCASRRCDLSDIGMDVRLHQGAPFADPVDIKLQVLIALCRNDYRIFIPFELFLSYEQIPVANIVAGIIPNRKGTARLAVCHAVHRYAGNSVKPRAVCNVQLAIRAKIGFHRFRRHRRRLSHSQRLDAQQGRQHTKRQKQYKNSFSHNITPPF